MSEASQGTGGGDVRVSNELIEAIRAVEHVVGPTAARERAGVDPAAINAGEGVTGVAGDQQLVALLGGGEGVGTTGEAEAAGSGAVEPVEAGEIADVSQAEGEGVVTRAAEIKGFNRGEA